MKKILKVLLFIAILLVMGWLIMMSVCPTVIMDLRAKLTGKEVGEFDIATETEPFYETTFYDVYNDNVHRYWDSYEPYKKLITAAEAVGTKYVWVESGELDQGPSGIPIKMDMESLDIKAYAVDKDTFEDGLRNLNERYVKKFPQESMGIGIIPQKTRTIEKALIKTITHITDVENADNVSYGGFYIECFDYIPFGKKTRTYLISKGSSILMEYL